MGRRGITNYAAVKDVQTKPNVELCAEDVEHIAMPKMNPLHLEQKTRTLLQPTHMPICVVLDLHPEDQKEVVFLKR